MPGWLQAVIAGVILYALYHFLGEWGAAGGGSLEVARRYFMKQKQKRKTKEKEIEEHQLAEYKKTKKAKGKKLAGRVSSRSKRKPKRKSSSKRK